MKTTARLNVKFVQISTNKVVLNLPSDSMEVHQFFANEFVDQIMKQSFKNIDLIGPIKIVVDQDFLLK